MIINRLLSGDTGMFEIYASLLFIIFLTLLVFEGVDCVKLMISRVRQPKSRG
jgi:hypothetical protein